MGSTTGMGYLQRKIQHKGGEFFYKNVCNLLFEVAES